jgi:hypothetical protein
VHVNRNRDTPTSCPTLQVLNMSTVGDTKNASPVIRFLSRRLQNLMVSSNDCLRNSVSQLW